MYILLLLMLACNVQAQESYVIDSLCVSSTRHYRIDGEKGSTYQWFILDTAGTTIADPVPSGFTVINAPGDTTWGSEVDYNWTITGEFSVTVLQFSTHGCDTIETGRVKVFDPPFADAGKDIDICYDIIIPVSGDTAMHFSTFYWTTSGDGTFNFTNKLHPVYTLGTSDITTGTIYLILTAEGLAANKTCEPAIDTMVIRYSNPKVTLQPTDLICFNDSSGSIIATVTGGFEPYVFDWTGPGGFTATGDTLTGLAAGKYYLTVTDALGCTVTDSAELLQPPPMLAQITPDDPAICENDSLRFGSSFSGGTGIYTVLWTGDGAVFLDDPVSGTPLFSNAPGGNYQLILNVTDEQGCQVADTSLIIVHPVERDSILLTACENELPALWRSMSLYTAGFYSDTLSSVYGCDSILTAELIIYPVERDSVQLTACENELPLLWNGNPVSLPGFYADTLKTIHGCDSILVAELIVYPVSRDSMTLIACENNMPVWWRNRWLTTAGFFSDTLKTIHGCDSIFVAELLINPVERDSSAYLVACENELPVEWRGNWLDTPGFHSDTLKTIYGCDSIFVAELIVFPVSRDSIQLTACENELPVPWRSMLLNTAGFYSDTLTSVNGCDSIFTAELIIHPVERDSVQLIACENELPYIWNSFALSVPGFYADTLKTIYGCDSILVAELLVFPVERDSIQITACENELPLMWRGNWLTAAGFYSDTLKTIHGCDSIFVAELFVYPVARDSSAYLTACENELPVEWRGKWLDTPGFHSDTLKTIYGCDSIFVAELFVYPVARDSVQLTACENELPVTWRGMPIDTAGFWSDTLTSVYGCDSIFVAELIIHPVERDSVQLIACENELPYNWNTGPLSIPGFYSDTLKTIYGCDSIIVAELLVFPVERDSIQLTACENELPYEWYGQSLVTPGFYSDTLKTIYGCDSILVAELLIFPVARDSSAQLYVCENEMPVFWRSRFLYSPGFHSDTLKTIHGCDSVFVAEVIVFPVERDTVQLTACENTLPMPWRGLSLNTTGFYADTLISVNGCDSIFNVDFEVIPLNRDTLELTVCENDLPVTWHGVVFTSADTVIQNLASTTTGCDTVRVLQLQTLPINRDTLSLTICDGQLPYNWQGIVFTSADTVIQNINSVTTGCDTIRVLQLQTVPYIEEIHSRIICENDLPYSWYGEIFVTADTITQNIPSSIANCDTVRILQLQTIPVINQTLDLTVCENELPYIWQGVTFSEADTIIQNIASVTAGCDTVRTLRLQTIPNHYLTDQLTINENQLPYTWYGILFTQADTLTDIVPSTTGGCDTLLTLMLNTIPGVPAFDTLTICETSLPYNWNGEIFTSAGSVEKLILATVAGDPDTVLTMHLITVAPQPVSVSIAANFPEACTGKSITFTATPVNGGQFPIYAWFVNGVQMAGQTASTFTYIPQNGDEVYARLTSDMECVLNDQATSNVIVMVVSDNIMPRFESIGPFCLNSVAPDLPLVSLNGIKGTWSPSKINTSLAWSRTYRFTPDPGECGDPYEIDIEILPLTTPSFAQIDPICQFGVAPALPKVSVNGISGTWSPDTIMTDKHGIFTFVFTPDPEFICSDITTLQIEILPGMKAELDPIGPFCQFEAAPALPATDKNGSSGTWSPSVILTDLPGQFTFTFTPDASYTCAAPDSIVIQVNQYTPVTFDPIGPLCQNEVAPPLPLTTNEGIKGTWSPSAIATDSTGTFIYKFIPDDEKLCIFPSMLAITVTPEIRLSAKVTNDYGKTEPTGSINLTISGGTAPFNIIWSNAKTTEDISGLKPGDYKVVVTDINGCQSDTTITIISTTPELEMYCTPVITVGCFDEVAAYPPFADFNEYLAAGGSVKSNCDIDTASFRLLSTDTITGGYCMNITRTYTLKNSCDLTATCIQYINVNDTVKPLISCMSDISSECPPTTFTSIRNLSDFIAAGGTVSDNCMLDSLSFTSDTVRIHTATGLDIITTFSIKDKCGNTNFCTQTLSVSDTIAPQVACKDLLVHLDGSGIYTLSESDIQIITAGTFDNCTKPENLTIVLSRNTFTCTDVENGIEVTIKVIDEAGNSDSCLAVISVADSIPPTAICKNINVYLDEHGKASITAQQINNGSSDNCAIDTLFLDRYNFDCTDVGVNQVALTVVDKVSLQDQCIAKVTVIDTVKPVVACNGPFEIQLDENAEYKLTVGEVATTYPVDACGIDTVYVFPHALDCDHIGLTTITLAAVGVNGDTAYCQTVVEIFGNRPPNVLPDSAETDENTPVEIDVVANDSDEKTNIDISSQRIVIQPKWGTAVRNPINGVITYTPNRNFNGVDIIQYEICDDGIPCEPECGRTYVYIKVNAINEAPVADDDRLSASCSSVSQNLLWNDSDPDNDLLTINTNPLVPPNHGVAIIDADGMLNYFPNDGFIGRDSLQYVVCDNGIPSMCDTAWVYIDVDCNEENENPIECILFVPEGFSPNGDGIHEFFRVMCMHLYPDATMRIFNRNGNLLWMKKNYGNYDVWGDAQNAWWWGNTTYQWDQGNRSVPGQEGKLVKVGNYVWVLELGNGEIKNGTVMVAY